MIPSSHERELFNAAFLGYKLASNGLFIRCCSACPGKPIVERWAAGGTKVPVSHGYCGPHAAAMMAEITGERP